MNPFEQKPINIVDSTIVWSTSTPLPTTSGAWAADYAHG